MSSIKHFVLVLCAIVLALQTSSAYTLKFSSLNLSTSNALTTETLAKKFSDANVEQIDLYNVGYGSYDLYNSTYSKGLKFPYNDLYGEPAIRIKLNGNQAISKVTIKADIIDGYFTVNGKIAEANSKNTSFTVELNDVLSVLDICFHLIREEGNYNYEGYITSIDITTQESSIPEPSVGELTYSDFIRPASGEVVYVNPGQTLTAVSQCAETVKVLFDDKEIASSNDDIVSFTPMSSGCYSVIASNAIGDAKPSKFDIVVSDRRPAHGSFVTFANEIEDGHYYLICGTQDDDKLMSKDLSRLDYVKKLNDGPRVVRDYMLVVKAVKSGDYWHLITDEGEGLCDADGNLAIGEPALVDIQQFSQGVNGESLFYIKIGDKYLQTSSYNKIKLDSQRPNNYEGRFMTMPLDVAKDCITEISFDRYEGIEDTYAVGRVDVSLSKLIDADEYSLICDGEMLANFVDGSVSAYLPSKDCKTLSVVRKTNGLFSGIQTINEDPWSDIKNVTYNKVVTGNQNLLYDSWNSAVHALLPFKAESDYGFTSNIKCEEYPQAYQIEKDYYQAVYIPLFLTNVEMSDLKNFNIPPVKLEITPDIKVASPLDSKRVGDYSTGVVRGLTTTLTYDFVYSDVSSVDIIEADAVDTKYYTIDGLLMDGSPTIPGIYLKRVGNKTTKVVIK